VAVETSGGIDLGRFTPAQWACFRGRAGRLPYAERPAGEPNLPLLMDLRPTRPGAVWTSAEPALAPGEQRTRDLPLPVGADAVEVRVVYGRNAALIEGSLFAEILHQVRPLGPWRLPRD
jgi:hypothetical protein